MDARTQLHTGIQTLGLTLADAQIDQLLAYMQLIQAWNKAYNLVGTSETGQLIQKHLLDSLTIVPYLAPGNVLDVGSGAGLPGIPLAIALPDISFTLLDSKGKKARFMRQSILQLKLNNVDVVQARVEQYQAKLPASSVLARAFAPLDKALDLLGRVCAQQGVVQIMLGTSPEQLPQSKYFQHIEVIPISVPGLSSERHLLIAQRV